jgi:hypothetical protein
MMSSARTRLLSRSARFAFGLAAFGLGLGELGGARGDSPKPARVTEAGSQTAAARSVRSDDGLGDSAGLAAAAISGLRIWERSAERLAWSDETVDYDGAAGRGRWRSVRGNDWVRLPGGTYITRERDIGPDGSPRNEGIQGFNGERRYARRLSETRFVWSLPYLRLTQGRGLLWDLEGRTLAWVHDRTLSELLGEATGVRAEWPAEDRVRVGGVSVVGDIPMKVVAVVDPQCGFVPVSVFVGRFGSDSPSMRVDVSAWVEVGGVWVPTEGVRTAYYLLGPSPDELSAAQSELSQVHRDLERDGGALGLQPATLEALRQHLRIESVLGPGRDGAEREMTTAVLGRSSQVIRVRGARRPTPGDIDRFTIRSAPGARILDSYGPEQRSTPAPSSVDLTPRVDRPTPVPPAPAPSVASPGLTAGTGGGVP